MTPPALSPLIRRPVLASASLVAALMLAACGGGSPAPATGTPTPAATATADVARLVVTRGAPGATPSPVPTPEPAGTAAPTVSPSPTLLPSPTPTSGPLNDPVPAPPTGGASCGDYPCPEDSAGWEARIRVPPGYAVEVLALLPGSPNSITYGPDGLLYAATMGGQIWRVDDGGEIELYIDGLDVPVGLAFEPGTDRLYISSRAGSGEAQVSVLDGDRVRQLFGGVPCCYAGMHAANGIAFGPDGYGYVAVGARSDHGEVLNSAVQDTLHPWEASILRFSPDGSEIGTYARGLRNAYDIAWDAAGRLFAADNAPDYGPPDEFHLVVPGAEHGYPWYDCDVCFAPPPGVEIVPPLHDLITHGAPTGLVAYKAERFPGVYDNLFLTLWSAFPGAQKVVRFGPGGEGMTDFATGFAAPIDVTVDPIGRLVVADWATGVLFRIDVVAGAVPAS